MPKYKNEDQYTLDHLIVIVQELLKEEDIVVSKRQLKKTAILFLETIIELLKQNKIVNIIGFVQISTKLRDWSGRTYYRGGVGSIANHVSFKLARNVKQKLNENIKKMKNENNEGEDVEEENN